MRRKRSGLRLESLEVRDVPSITLYELNFTTSTPNTVAPGVTPTWTGNQAISTSPSGEKFLGQFTNNTVTLTLNNLPNHDGVTVEFDAYFLRSWDGNDTQWGPDKWSFKIDNAAQVDATFRNSRNQPTYTASQKQTYSPSTPLGTGGLFNSGTGATITNSLGYTFANACGTQRMDSTYRFSFPVAHGATSVTLAFQGSGLQGLSDESWGIDNLKVTTSPPTVTVEKIADAAEGGANGTFRFARTGSTSQPLTLNYSIAGTATVEVDYVRLQGASAFSPLYSSITIPANKLFVDVPVTAMQDNVVDRNETVTATIANGTGYTVGSQATALVVISDDPPSLSISSSQDAIEPYTDDDGVFHEAVKGRFDITRVGGDPTEPFAFKIDKLRGIAIEQAENDTPDADYQKMLYSEDGKITLTFDPHQTTMTLQVEPLQDDVWEDAESVVASISPSLNYNIIVGIATVLIQQPAAANVVSVNSVTMKEYFAYLDSGVNSADIYALHKDFFGLDFTDPAIKARYETKKAIISSATEIRQGELVAKGSALTNVNFKLSNYDRLTNEQKTNYFLQTVKRQEAIYDAAGALIGRDTSYVAEGFQQGPDGVSIGVDTHAREGMIAGYTVDKKRSLKTVWTAEYTIGFGKYNGEAIGSNYKEFYKSAAPPAELTAWDPAKISYIFPSITYKTTFTLDGAGKWTFSDTGASIDLSGWLQ